MAERLHGVGGRPPRAAAWLVSAAVTVTWGYLRLVVFSDSHVPIAYVLPLLVSLWTRDRQTLWAMAAAFGTFHTLKVFWILPAGAVENSWAIYGSTLVNIIVGSAVIHTVINLRDRLDESLARVQAQADELHVQGEELTQQNEELAQQGEELANRNEELQSQTEEIGSLNEALERRERLLQALLDTARASGSERDALDHIAGAARDLFHGNCAAVAVYQSAPEGLRLMTAAAGALAPPGHGEAMVPDGFVALVLDEQRTACLTDAALRPDLTLAAPSLRAALCAPIHVGGEIFGGFAVYATAPHEWTDEEFRLAEWLADQCGRVLQTLRVQSALRELDQRKSEFLATLSHELRNPLTALGFALTVIESGPQQDTRAAGVARRQLQQLERLVDDLLDATRLSSNKIQLRKAHADFREIVRDAADASKPDVERAGHEMIVSLPDAPVWVDGDADRLGQLVANLINNAARYTPEGGRVTVTVQPSGTDAVLTVADTGVGMQPEDLERVFQMFAQVEGPGSGGLGIGLALVKGIAELHGGRVQAHSDGPGRGSTFTVTLPLAGLTRPAEAARQEASPVASSSRVLIVDDNVDAAEMMGALLETHGHTVRIAHDAEGALAAARDFRPYAAVLDIGLPGADGYELARRLREDDQTRAMRLIALTGWSQDADRIRARDAGFDAHLTKPADPDLILAAIGRSEPA